MQKWTVKELNGKSVQFRIELESGGFAIGTGIFDAYEREGIVSAIIKSSERFPSGQSHDEDIMIDSGAIDLISLANPGMGCEFLFCFPP